MNVTFSHYKDTLSQFECTRLITTDQVKAIIKLTPIFGKHPNSRDKVARRSVRSEA